MKSKHIKLKTVFMGTSYFGKKILQALIKENYNITAVYTKPDAKAGRKQQVAENPVRSLALEKDIPIFQPVQFSEEEIKKLKETKPDLIIVASYGKILPKEVLDLPGFGCINVHASLLPKYRGASPVQNAILAGEKETGATIMLMSEGLDTGDILSQKKIKIEDKDTSQTLLEIMSDLSSKLLINTIPNWINRRIEPVPQDSSKATLCQLIDREDGKINWIDEAEDIYNRYRALYPWPGIFSFWKNNEKTVRIKILKAMLLKGGGTGKKEGEVFEKNGKIAVAASNGAIILEDVQIEGKNPMNAAEFVNGYPNFIGSILM